MKDRHMTAQDTERRLTVILIADIVGYSRLMARDAEGKFAVYRNTVFP